MQQRGGSRLTQPPGRLTSRLGVSMLKHTLTHLPEGEAENYGSSLPRDVAYKVLSRGLLHYNRSNRSNSPATRARPRSEWGVRTARPP